jgi:hypothetical protein
MYLRRLGQSDYGPERLWARATLKRVYWEGGDPVL